MILLESAYCATLVGLSVLQFSPLYLRIIVALQDTWALAKQEINDSEMRAHIASF